jgi:hypothetical protein
LHNRTFWTHLKTRSDLIRALRCASDFELFTEVLHVESDQFSTMTGLTHALTGGQAIY